MNSDNFIWFAVGIAFAFVAIALIVARSRRQRVSFDATAAVPPPMQRTIDPRPDTPPPPPPASAAPDGDGAELTRLKGLGPKAASRLAELGIVGIAELAALGEEDARVIDAQMGPLQGRLERDRWIEQAQLLARGDVEAYEQTFGKLGE